jgi:hypothetical protein
VWGREALIHGINGERELLNLSNGEVQPFSLSNKYVLAGDKWLYFESDFVVAFDRDLKKVLWTKRLKPDVQIGALKSFAEGGSEFLAVDYANGEVGEFYQLVDDSFYPIDQGRVSWVGSDRAGNVYYVKNDSEFWGYSLYEEEGAMIARFYLPFALISTDLRAYHSNGVFLFSRQNEYWLSDGNFLNVKQLFEGKNVLAMDVVDGKKLYIWIGMDEGAKASSNAGLYVYNLEQ